MAEVDHGGPRPGVVVPAAMNDPFVEQWFSRESQDVLANLGRIVADVPGLVVEIGSWTGRSSCALANAIFPRVLDCVDTWQGSPGEVSSELASHRDVFSQWKRNTETFTRGNVRPHRMGWREFVPAVDGLVALAFIDAEHTYIEVKENAEALVPLMAAGGVMCGDDAHHPPVREAVLELFGDRVVFAASLWIVQF